MWKIRRNFSHLEEFGRGSMEGRVHLAEVVFRVFQKEEQLEPKVQRLGRTDHILQNSVSGLTLTIYTCLRMMPKGYLLAGEWRYHVCVL